MESGSIIIPLDAAIAKAQFHARTELYLRVLVDTFPITHQFIAVNTNWPSMERILTNLLLIT